MLNIPKGYCLVPESWVDKFFKKIGWIDVIEPTITEVSEYIGISPEKIKSDLNNIDCPLRQTYKGGKGRGNEKKFEKTSVELYQRWIKK
jgi:hypothetical protein